MHPSNSGAIHELLSASNSENPRTAVPGWTGSHDPLHTIAYVEDEESDRILARQVLGKSGKFHPVRLYASAEQALREMPVVWPEFVLVDIRMPEISGIECTRRLKSVMPQATIVVLSGYQDEDWMDSAWRAGADWYLVKPLTVVECLAMLKFMTPARTPLVDTPDAPGGRPIRGWNSAGGDRQLTVRQNEIMELLAEGLPYKLIADRLRISFSAVHQHLHTVFKRLDAGNRTEAINKWKSSYEI